MLIRYIPKILSFGALFILIPFLPAVADSQSCQYATQLVVQAYEAGNQGDSYEEKSLLKKALRYCPHDADAHNNLASLLENEGNYQQAIYHYQQAIPTKPDLSDAWYGMGETYYKLGQFPLSLEAHLQACQTDKDSQKRVKELLKESRYAVTEEGQILNKESLLLLYDKQQRERINGLISNCGWRDPDSRVKGKGIFRNLTFHTGEATLTKSAKQQLKNLAAAFKQTMPTVIKLHGHTDSQAFKGITEPSENDRLNLKLSQRRAEAVQRELAARGIPKKRIQTRGYGSRQPLYKGFSKTAYAKNRRVEIESID